MWRIPTFYRSLVFDSNEMERVMRSLTDGHCSYKLGEKVWHPSNTEPEDVDELDCSGFTRYLLYKTTSPQEDCPSGSHKQESWFRKEGFQEVGYATEAHKIDNKVRIAFRDRTRSKIRHVWFVLNGWTIECTNKGSNNGPSSLLWSDRTNEADDCFVLGRLSPPRFPTSRVPTAGQQHECRFLW